MLVAPHLPSDREGRFPAHRLRLQPLCQLQELLSPFRFLSLGQVHITMLPTPWPEVFICHQCHPILKASSTTTRAAMGITRLAAGGHLADRQPEVIPQLLQPLRQPLPVS